MLAAAEIRAGDAELVVAGGMEIDEPGAVPAAQAPLRLPARQRRAHRRDRPRRPVVRHRGLPHGHPRRAGGDQRPRQPRGPGRVRAREPPEGDRRHRRRPVRRRDRAGHGPRRQGPRDGRRRSTRARAATRRIEALARLKPAFALPDGEDRGAATVARSPPATRPGSRMAPPRRSSPASAPSSGSG